MSVKDRAVIPTEFQSTAQSPSEMIDSPEPVGLPAGEATNNSAQGVDYYIGLALGGHPRIRAARARYCAATHRVVQEHSLDDPVLSNTFWPISDQALQTAAGRAGNTMSLAQKFPWPEKRRAKAAIASREAQIAAAKLRQTELTIIESVRLVYDQLWFATRAIEIMAENREIAGELVKLATARNKAGGSQQDVLRAQLKLDSLDDQLVDLRRQKGLAQADLAALIQQPGRQDIEPASLEIADPLSQLDALFAAAQQCSPRLQQHLWAVSRDRQKQRLACLNKYPDFTLGAGWTTITESDAVAQVANGHDNVSLMVGVTLPIWRDRIDASINEARCEAVASSRELRDARDDTFRQIRRLTEEALAAEERLQLFNERIVPRAKRNLQLASADYRGQLVDFGEVADSFTEVLMFELQAARAQATLADALAQIERQVGCEVVIDSPSL